MLHLTEQPPLSLYVHIPWCLRKCPYCDFNSHVSTQPIPQKQYIEALIVDLEKELPSIKSREIISIFIGGGTPSLFSAESIDTLLNDLRGRLNLRPDVEITLEANPGAVERERLAEFRSCGISRLSLGVQSFQDKALQSLGRIHDGNDARIAIETAKLAGFDNLNIDLMYGLPGQSEAEAQSDLIAAMSYQPQHISHYQLTIEPDTAFYIRPPRLPDDDRIWTMQLIAGEHLIENDYRQYEVSAWARQGYLCRHNMNYWQFGDYLGIGAGAHQKLTLPDQQRICRCVKQRIPSRYMQTCRQQNHISENKVLTPADILFEFMLNALRLVDGFTVKLITQRTGLSYTEMETSLEMAEHKQLIERDAFWIKPTESGRRYLNELLLLFMP